MITLHTYGDSHSTFYGSWSEGIVGDVKIPGIKIENLTIKTNHLPGTLAFSFGRDKPKIVNNIKEKDILVFCFGEIDCRCHIHKYIPEWKENIDDIIFNYFEAINKNVKDIKDIKVCVYNVIPPIERELPENIWMNEYLIKEGVPALGSDEDRKKYTLYMNEKIKEYCKLYSFIYFDIYDKYAGNRGFLKKELSDDNCHIRDSIYIEEFIKTNLL